MTHVIIGWGSLLWDPGTYRLKLASSWESGGPKVPIEFSRISDSRAKALTLVIDPDHGAPCPTSFAISDRKSLDDTICDLRCREGTVLRRIGFAEVATRQQRAHVYPELAEQIRSWAQDAGFSSAVWTDLPSNFEEKIEGPFSVQAALEYLRTLPASGAQKAKEYITRAPPEVSTPLRTALEAAPWWEEFGET